jgi:hypothetical protein
MQLLKQTKHTFLHTSQQFLSLALRSELDGACKIYSIYVVFFVVHCTKISIFPARQQTFKCTDSLNNKRVCIFSVHLIYALQTIPTVNNYFPLQKPQIHRFHFVLEARCFLLGTN